MNRLLDAIARQPNLGHFRVEPLSGGGSLFSFLTPYRRAFIHYTADGQVHFRTTDGELLKVWHEEDLPLTESLKLIGAFLGR